MVSPRTETPLSVRVDRTEKKKKKMFALNNSMALDGASVWRDLGLGHTNVEGRSSRSNRLLEKVAGDCSMAYNSV